MRNPFKFGKEVSGYQFYDRKSDQESLYRKLADGSTNVVLLAPRPTTSRTVCRRSHRSRSSALPVSSTLHTAMNELVDDGIVETEGRTYRLADPMLVRYVRQSSVRLFANDAAGGPKEIGGVVER